MRHPHASRRGQGVIEYAFILVIVAIVTIVIILTMGGAIKNVFNNVVCSLNESTTCATLQHQPSTTPTPCPALLAPTVFPEVTSTPVYTFTPSDFASHKQVLQGSVIRLLFDCPSSQASYRSLVGTALVPILVGPGYAVFVASSSGTAQITGPIDHSSNSPLWSIDVTVIAP